MNRVCVGILMLLATANPRSWADDPPGTQSEPPARLQKKPRANEKPELPPKGSVETKKTPQAKPEDTLPPEERGKSLEDVMERLVKNLRDAETHLAKNDTGEGTQQIQRDIAKDLEDLLEQMKREDKKQQAENKNLGSRPGEQSRRQRTEQCNDSSQGGAPRQPSQQVKQNALKRSGTRKEEKSKIADLYKDVWGHLPETLRPEMDQYSRERFMDKYSELLKQYYQTIAEKSNRKRE